MNLDMLGQTKNTAVNKYRSFKLRILILMGRHFSNVFVST